MLLIQLMKLMQDNSIIIRTINFTFCINTDSRQISHCFSGTSTSFQISFGEEGNVTYSTNEAYAGQFSFGVGDGLNTLEIGDVNEQTGEFTIEQEGVLLNFNACCTYLLKF